MEVASDLPHQQLHQSTAAHDAAVTTPDTTNTPAVTVTESLSRSTPLHHAISITATPLSSSSVAVKAFQPFSAAQGSMECYNLSSPSSRLFHSTHQLTPLSSVHCPSSAPPLSLPPSHYHYFDGASYADESVVSSVDDYALLSSVHSTTSDELLSHFDQHDDKPTAHDKYVEGGAVDTSHLLSFTPCLQPIAAPPSVEYEDAYGSESSVASSSAAPSPIFQSSSLPPLSPTLAGQLSSSSSVHTDLSTHPRSTPHTPCDVHSPAPPNTPTFIQPQQSHSDMDAAYTQQHPSASSIFYEPHTSPQPHTQCRHLLPPPIVSAAPMPPLATFSGQSHALYPVVPLAPSDSVCSAPFLPPVTGSPFPFSPPIPLGHTADGGSGMAAADYVAASYSKLKAAAATMVQTRPNDRRDWTAAKIELPATNRAASRAAKARKRAAGKNGGRKRKRDESEDSDSDSDSTNSSSSSSSSSDSGSDSDESTATSARRRISASGSVSSGPRRKPLSKKERNKVSASAYRKRKKAHIVALHGVADTLKTTVVQQSDMIDSITNENKALREQLSFIQKLFGTSTSFLAPQKEKAEASLPVARSTSPELTAAVPPPSAVAPIATVCTSEPVTVTEADKLDQSAPLLKSIVQEPEVTVKKEAEGPSVTAAMIPSSVSSAQRASIFLFVIFTCFLLFNPQSLHTPLTDISFTQLTASFLNFQYSGGVDIPCAATASPLSPASPLSFLSSLSSASAASLLSPEVVMRRFLDGSMGDESFFAEVLERTYAPLVRLVGEEAAQSALMRLAGGMLTLQLKRQPAVVAMEGGGGPVEAGSERLKVETETEGEAEMVIETVPDVLSVAAEPLLSQ